MKKLSLTFLISLAFTFIALIPISSLAASKVKETPAISIQLWSVKDTLKKDFEGTLRRLAEMGFNGVEFAGFYGSYQDNPAKLRQLLTSLNLTASAAHVGIDVFAPDVIHKNLLFFKTLGITNIIVPWDERAWHPEKISQLTQQLTSLEKVIANYDMKIGFHNHQHEFAPFKQQTYWDYIAQHTPDNVVLQLDVGWVRFADKDPIDYITRYPGRTLTTHFKIRTKSNEGISPIIGKNQFAWDQLLNTVINVGGAQWIVMEQEEYPNNMSELDAVAESKKGLDGYVSLYLNQ